MKPIINDRNNDSGPVSSVKYPNNQLWWDIKYADTPYYAWPTQIKFSTI